MTLFICTGPRFVLNLVRIFEGSFGGATLYENPNYVSPNEVGHSMTWFYFLVI